LLEFYLRATAREKLEIVLFVSASRLHSRVSVGQARRGGRKGGLGGIPPALQILGEISSDFFKYTPQRLNDDKNQIL